MHRAAHVIPAHIFIDGSANGATKQVTGLQRAMAIHYMDRMTRVRSPAIMIVGALGLCVAAAPSALGQAVPRQLPPEPAPELPSVNDYSLPPGEGQTPTGNQAEGPVEENIPPPQAAPTPDSTTSGNLPASRPVPVIPTPQPGATPVNRGQDRPAPVANTQPNTPANPARRATPASPSTDNGNTTAATTDNPATNESQPSPGFSTDLPNQALPSTSAPASDTIESPATPQISSDGKFGYYAGAAILFLLLGGLGIYLWRRKTSASSFAEEVEDDFASIPMAEPTPAPIPRKPAPKIYSPPNPAEPKKPSPVMSNGFVTSQIGVTPEPKPQAKAPLIRPVAPQPPKSAKPEVGRNSDTVDHLKIEFIASGASSTLLNAVLNYTITLTNTSDADLHDINLSGAMMQADAATARDDGIQTGHMLHQIENLSAGETVTLTGDIRLPLNAIRPIIFKSQALFIPLARFGVVYADQNDAQHQQSLSFIVGREYEPPRPKMAPFRLDLGPKIFHPVGQRPLNA